MNASLCGPRPLLVAVLATALFTSAAAAIPQIGGGGGLGYYSKKVITSSGFRWDFDKFYQIGQFATGDWWVVAPNGVTLESITPATEMQMVGNAEWWRNGTHVDPVAGSYVQGLDSSMYANLSGFQIGGGYDNSKNIARQLPYTVSPGADGIASVCTARSMETHSQRPQVFELEVLTVLSAAPPANAFRPTYTVNEAGQHQEGWLTKADLTYSRLNVTDAFGDSLDASVISEPPPPSIAACLQYAGRTWYEAPGGAGYLKRYSRPAAHMPDYGYDVANLFQIMAMRTLLDDLTVAARKPLVDELVQIGFDRYNMAIQDQVGGTPGISNYSGHWDETAGHGCAAKFSILYYAWLAGFPHQTASVLASNLDQGPATSQWFQIDTQCFYVDAATPGYTYCGYGTLPGYVPPGTPEWGIGHHLQLWAGLNPTHDDPHWTESASTPDCPLLCSNSPCSGGTPNVRYRTCCTASGWSLEVLMSRIITDNLASVPSTWASGYLYPTVVYDYLDRFHALQPVYGYPPSSTFHFNKEWFGGSQMHRQAWEAWGATNVYFSRP